MDLHDYNSLPEIDDFFETFIRDFENDDAEILKQYSIEVDDDEDVYKF